MTILDVQPPSQAAFASCAYKTASTLDGSVPGLVDILHGSRKAHAYPVPMPHYVSGGSGVFHLQIGSAGEWYAINAQTERHPVGCRSMATAPPPRPKNAHAAAHLCGTTRIV